jgi:hypothetical protein
VARRTGAERTDHVHPCCPLSPVPSQTPVFCFNHQYRHEHSLTCSADKTCWETGSKYSEGGAIPSLVAGANIAGFIKVADAMRDQGDWW